MEKIVDIFSGLQKKEFFCVCTGNGGQGAKVTRFNTLPDTEGEGLFLRNNVYNNNNNNNNNLLYYIILYIMQNLKAQYKILRPNLRPNFQLKAQLFAWGQCHG